MATFILALAASIVLIFITLQNTLPISFHIFTYTFTNIPIFIIIFASFGIGLVVTFLLSTFDAVRHFFIMQQKEKEISRFDKEVAHLHTRIDQLTEENQRLKDEKNTAYEERDKYKPSLFDRIRQSVS